MEKQFSLPPLEQVYKDYLHSDYFTQAEKESGAEVPVPERLFPKRKSQALVNQLKLSQKIGLLLWMNDHEVLSIGGNQRLLYLQRKASEEALVAGIKFRGRLHKEEKLQKDFLPHMRELNRRPQSKRFRKSDIRRMGVGYRDKGTLPAISSQARRKANQEAFVLAADVPSGLRTLIDLFAPLSYTEDGEWIDLSCIVSDEFLDENGEIKQLPSPL